MNALPEDVLELKIAANRANDELYAHIAKQPCKQPRTERQAFGPGGKSACNDPSWVALWERERKAFGAWERRRKLLHRKYIDLSNAAFYAEKGLPRCD